MELGLGTVQFGLDYGVSNTAGRTPIAEVEEILRLSSEAGIRYLDTASDYGDSENILGKAIDGPSAFRIVTKIPPLPADRDLDGKRSFITDIVERSATYLAPSKIYGLLFHNADDLTATGGEEIFESARRIAASFRIRKVGASIYTREQIDRLLEGFPIDLVQVPINVFDQRLVKSGHIEKLKDSGTEVHARSIFLQGLLLMAHEDIPRHFDPIRPLLASYRARIAEAGLSPVGAALAFAKQVIGIDVAIVGVNDATQLVACIEAFGAQQTIDFSPFACDLPHIMDPRRWPPRPR